MLPFVLIITRCDLRIEYMNKVACKILGHTSGELRGKPLQAILAEGNAVGLIEKIMNYVEDREWCGRLIFETGTKQNRILRMFVTAPTNEDDEISAYVFSNRSLCDPEKNHSGVRRNVAGVQLSDLPEEMLTGTTAGEIIVRELTHQLNNPLVGVFNFSQLLLEKVSPDQDVYTVAQTIYEAARECKEIVNEWRNKYYDAEKS